MNKIAIVKQEENKIILEVRNKERIIARYELTTISNGALNLRTLKCPEGK